MAAAADWFLGGPTVVRLQRSPLLKVLAEELRHDVAAVAGYGGPRAAGAGGRVDAGHGGDGWPQRGAAAGPERGLLGPRPGAGVARASLPPPRKVCDGDGSGAGLQPRANACRL
ncbi:hypothetical protein AAY473_018174 [Plecturocebus cupreus]